jgi:murein DD-endopeptidase MepM/ murein hydrolase activator NlpD
MRRLPGITFEIRTDDDRHGRTIHLSSQRFRTSLVAAGIALLGTGFVLGSWWYFALRTIEARDLRARVASLDSQVVEVDRLVTLLDQLEDESARFRSLFGWDTAATTVELWVPPASVVPARSRSADAAGDSLPSVWPLSQAGTITREVMMTSDGRQHTGLDIAVPMDSYIRSAAAGTVIEAGESQVYGRYAVVQHADGWTTRYAHASNLFVETGQHVRSAEVIGLTGNSGESTAPHLHFEVVHDGQPIDPLQVISDLNR